MARSRMQRFHPAAACCVLAVAAAVALAPPAGSATNAPAAGSAPRAGQLSGRAARLQAARFRRRGAVYERSPRGAAARPGPAAARPHREAGKRAGRCGARARPPAAGDRKGRAARRAVPGGGRFQGRQVRVRRRTAVGHPAPGSQPVLRAAAFGVGRGRIGGLRRGCRRARRARRQPQYGRLPQPSHRADPGSRGPARGGEARVSRGGRRDAAAHGPFRPGDRLVLAAERRRRRSGTPLPRLPRRTERVPADRERARGPPRRQAGEADRGGRRRRRGRGVLRRRQPVHEGAIDRAGPDLRAARARPSARFSVRPRPRRTNFRIRRPRRERGQGLRAGRRRLAAVLVGQASARRRSFPARPRGRSDPDPAPDGDRAPGADGGADDAGRSVPQQEEILRIGGSLRRRDRQDRHDRDAALETAFLARNRAREIQELAPGGEGPDRRARAVAGRTLSSQLSRAIRGSTRGSSSTMRAG